MRLLKHVTSFPVQHTVDPTDHLLRALHGETEDSVTVSQVTRR